jgi:putative phage-type endonuclease
MLTEEQKIARMNGLGASDSPIIMGYSSYKTPYQLYLEKTGLADSDYEETEQQYWGNALERAIVARFERDNDVKVTFPDTIHHPDYPFILANLDGWIESENAVLEIKCCNVFQRKSWDTSTSDGMPMAYLIQLAKQVAVSNADKGYCAVLIGGCEYMQFTYERDRALEELIIESDKEFWHKVQNRIEPDPSNVSDCRLKYSNVIETKTVHANYRTAKCLEELLDIKAEIKQLNLAEDAAKMQLMEHMKDAEYLVGLEGEILATWKANKKGTRVLNIK